MSFADSQFAGMYSQATGSPSQESKRVRQEEAAQPCLPVTIRMLEEAASEQSGKSDFVIHGIEPAMVIIVAAVETFVKQPTSLELAVNDGTGRLQVKMYTDCNEEEVQKIEAGKYVLIAGSPRTLPVLHFSAQTMRAVTSADEVSYHMIEACHACMKLKSGGAAERAPAAMKVGGNNLFSTAQTGPFSSPPKTQVPEDIDMTDSTAATPSDSKNVAAAIEAAAIPTPARAAPATTQLTGAALQARVLEVLKACTTEEGLSIDVVVKTIGNAKLQDVTEAIKNLQDEGECYDTIDENTFKAF